MKKVMICACIALAFVLIDAAALYVFGCEGVREGIIGLF
jgi:hypothetical protein